MGQSILAHHAHVFPESVRAEATIERLLRLLDACDIEQAVCFAPFAEQTAPQTIHHNRWLAKELHGRERLYGFGTIDFDRDDLDDQVREIVDLGLKGIKLHPNTQRFDVLAPAAMKVYAAAERHDLFCTFHSGVHHYRLAHYNVLKFDEVAWQFPNLRFSLEHVGGYHFFAEALAVIFNNIPFPPTPQRPPRVFAGLVSVFTPDQLRFWYMNDERMRELFAQVGARQVIFGLDFPYNLEANTKHALQRIDDLELSEPDKALVLGGNLRRELKL
jgi:predicted TIM-barrel fold metal-dependent hydrolase